MRTDIFANVFRTQLLASFQVYLITYLFVHLFEVEAGSVVEFDPFAGRGAKVRGAGTPTTPYWLIRAIIIIVVAEISPTGQG